MRSLGFQADLRVCLALRDERARENAAARARCRANAELCTRLKERAKRCGEPAINWEEYFRNVGINYP